MKRTEYVLRRGGIYLLGLFVMALGVSISKASDLGVSPVNSIPSVVSEITGVDMGVCTTLVFIGFIFVQLLILRREFKPVAFVQVLCSVIFGGFVSVTGFLCGLFLPPCENYAMRIVYVLVSIVFVALGILLYLEANVLSLPGEGVMQALSKKTGIALSTAKMIFDWGVVIISAILSLVCMGALVGVREGTVLAAIGVGLCLTLLGKLLRKRVQAFLAPPSQKKAVA